MSIIIDNIKKNSNRYFNDIAVYYRNKDYYESITNGELYNYVESLSEYFYNKYKNKIIAIIGDNKLEYIVSFLAFIGNIGDVLLLDKELHKDDILDILKKVKVDLIICDDELNLNFENYEQIKFSEINKIMQNKKIFNKKIKHYGNLILHTSGTTGKPKCVKITEANLYGIMMFNSLLLFGSSYNKNKKISIICYILLILNLLIVQVGKVNIYFLLINILIMASIPLLINKIKSKYVNAIASVGAILIWSVLIDVICYYIFPIYQNSLSLFKYVFNGIVFNFRFVVYNTIILVFIESFYYIKNFVVTKLEKRNIEQQLIISNLKY